MGTRCKVCVQFNVNEDVAVEMEVNITKPE